ncbi:hypothetical protein GCM10022223_01910 [Kineosporia mesophila]|uniref:Uncharacterized protein n=1 Tax=Kineosporia mesophila TaxID=566012 RepID=A0ABP6YUK3_9ACTN|nr:hypothetical protein [Kineosporia mesophila]MCD5352316.1 hypothetical protein [Kineosporia mesophila]
MTAQPAPGHGQQQLRRPLSPVEAALVAEACSRSDVVWVKPGGTDRYQAVWHTWHDDAVALVYGAGEQMLPVLTGEVEVMARSKDTGAAVIGFLAHVDTLTSHTPEWDAAATVLSAARLNAVDVAQQRERWASGAVVSLLRPIAVTVAAEGDDSTPTGSLPVLGGPGTTTEKRPFHLGSRLRRALRLRRRNDDDQN